MTPSFPNIIGILEGLHWRGDPLRLSENILIRTVKSKERFFVDDTLRNNQKAGRTMAFQPLERDSCLIEAYCPEKALMEVRRSADNLHWAAHEYLLHPLSMLRLFKSGFIGIRFVMVPMTSAWESFAFSESPYFRPAKQEFLPGRFALEPEEIEQLKNWARLKWVKDLVERPEVRWFNKAYMEGRNHDWIHSIFCSLEYLLFRDDQERSDLRYKFGLRGAWLLGHDYTTRREISRDLRKFFDLRYLVLNGNKNENFARGEFQLLARTEEYLRRIIAITLTKEPSKNKGTIDERILSGLGPEEDLQIERPLPKIEEEPPPPPKDERRLEVKERDARKKERDAAKRDHQSRHQNNRPRNRSRRR